MTKSMNATRVYVLIYPVLLPLAFFVTWLAGRLSLGYWPRPSLDDPKDIGVWVTVPYHLTLLLMVAGLPAFLGGNLVLAYRAYRDRQQRTHWLGVAVVSWVGLVAAITVLRWDPWQVVGWFMD